MRHKVGLVTGPGGSGETELQCRQADAALKCRPNNKVLMISDRNVVCDNQLDRFARIYPDSKPPVRVYARVGDIYTLGPVPERKQSSNQEMTPEDMAILQVIEYKRQDRTARRNGKADYSVENTVLRYIEQGTATLMDSMQKDGKPDEERTRGEVDIFAYLREAGESGGLRSRQRNRPMCLRSRAISLSRSRQKSGESDSARHYLTIPDACESTFFLTTDSHVPSLDER